jgi:hypothetical protein
MTIFLQDMGHCRSILDYLNNLADYAYFIERGEVLSPAGKRVITLNHSYGENCQGVRESSLCIDHLLNWKFITE